MTNHEIACERARTIAIEQLEETIAYLRNAKNVDEIYVLAFGCEQEMQWCLNAIDEYVLDRKAVAEKCREIFNIGKEQSS